MRGVSSAIDYFFQMVGCVFASNSSIIEPLRGLGWYIVGRSDRIAIAKGFGSARPTIRFENRGAVPGGDYRSVSVNAMYGRSSGREVSSASEEQ